MKITVATGYFSRLLNKNIDVDTSIGLSFARKSGAHSWLKLNNHKFDDQLLGSGLSVEKLVDNHLVNTPTRDAEKISTPLQIPFSELEGGSVGIDVQSVSEFFPSGLPIDAKMDKELLEIFTTKELSYAQSNDRPEQALAGIFSAKEAIKKCSKNLINLNSIEILPNRNGKLCSVGHSISISHSGEFSIAIAIPHESESYKGCDPVCLECSMRTKNDLIVLSSVFKRKDKNLYITLSGIILMLAIVEIARLMCFIIYD